jgi:helix-turn-helix protein
LTQARELRIGHVLTNRRSTKAIAMPAHDTATLSSKFQNSIPKSVRTAWLTGFALGAPLAAECPDSGE